MIDSAQPASRYDAPSASNSALGEVLDVSLVNTAPSETWAFLKAPRFWVMLIGALAVWGNTRFPELIGEPEMQLIATIATVFIAVRTFDRSIDKVSLMK